MKEFFNSKNIVLQISAAILIIILIVGFAIYSRPGNVGEGDVEVAEQQDLNVTLTLNENSIKLNSDGSYNIPFNISLKNDTQYLIYDINATSDLASAFGSNKFSIVSINSNSSYLNNAFDGVTDKFLVAQTSILNSGQSISVNVVIKLFPEDIDSEFEINTTAFGLIDLPEDQGSGDTSGNGDTGDQTGQTDSSTDNSGGGTSSDSGSNSTDQGTPDNGGADDTTPPTDDSSTGSSDTGSNTGQGDGTPDNSTPSDDGASGQDTPVGDQTNGGDSGAGNAGDTGTPDSSDQTDTGDNTPPDDGSSSDSGSGSNSGDSNSSTNSSDIPTGDSASAKFKLPTDTSNSQGHVVIVGDTIEDETTIDEVTGDNEITEDNTTSANETEVVAQEQQAEDTNIPTNSSEQTQSNSTNQNGQIGTNSQSGKTLVNTGLPIRITSIIGALIIVSTFILNTNFLEYLTKKYLRK